jgi:excisionase family DNA binding protein
MSETVVLYTPKETAALLKISERTVRRWIAEGTLPARRYGRQLRIERDAVLTLGVAADAAESEADAAGLALSSFATDWENDVDGTYDDWRALYGVPEG